MSSSTSTNEAGTRTEKHAIGSVQKVVKIGLVGDGTVGKSTLLMSYTMQSFVNDYIPTVFDYFSVIEDIEGMRVNVILADTAGQEDYVSVREVCYTKTDFFMVCFSLVDPNSFHNVKSKWLPELKQYAPNVPFVLVGTKTDLLNDDKIQEKLKAMGEENIKESQAKKLAKDYGAEMYLTVTGKETVSVNKLFHDSLKFFVARDLARLKKERKKWLKEAKKEDDLEKKAEKQRLKEEQKANK